MKMGFMISTQVTAVVLGLLMLMGNSICTVNADGNPDLPRTRFYSESCPNATFIIKTFIRDLVEADRSMPAALLRLHFHDCFVRGCDGSVLLDSTPGNSAEKDAFPNAGSIRGFEQVDLVKAKLEEICPGVVSCADILALLARDSIVQIGGTYWDVELGRKDGVVSFADEANVGLPSPFANFTELKRSFAQVGLNAKDLVILSGGHTIGKSKCGVFFNRLYGFSGPGAINGTDPTLDANFAAVLKSQCPPDAPLNTVFMDPSGARFPGQTWDNGYFKAVEGNRGLFTSDVALLTNKFAASLVASQAKQDKTFSKIFGRSMIKMGAAAPPPGSVLEIRKNCRVRN